MIRTQIQLTEEQSRALKQLAAQEDTTVAELVRQSVDRLIASQRAVHPVELRQRALSVVGKFPSGQADLSANHDRYAAEAYEA